MPHRTSPSEGSVPVPVPWVGARLAFTRPDDVSADHERPGLLRARSLSPSDAGLERCCDLRGCTIHDLGATDALRPALGRNGFETVALAPLRELQSTLARVRAAGRVSQDDARSIRRALRGASLRLAGGGRLRVLFIAGEGLIMRMAGPNGMAIDRDGAPTATNGHDAAVNVHADQDVRGTPVRQILRGAAPWLFRHEAPDGANTRSRLCLLNLWIPLDQVTRPLALMDARTLDRRRHQLRYGLATDSFLERDAERRVNDIWTFLHDDAQRWYFTSCMDARRGYVFDTLSTPHASFVLPGEDVAERRYRALEEVAAAARAGDGVALRMALGRADAEVGGPGGASAATPPLRRAIETMEALLEEARATSDGLCAGQDAAGWHARAAAALAAMVRKSIEMRMVAWLTATPAA